MISGFRRKVDEIGTLLGYYGAYSCNSVPTFRDNPSVPSSRGQDKKRAQISTKALLYGVCICRMRYGLTNLTVAGPLYTWGRPVGAWEHSSVVFFF